MVLIEADGDCQSLNGSHILCERWFPSLPDALDLLTTEFPDDEATPCPDDDMILIWEVRPDGFRKLAWGYFGSNYQGLTYASPACGQGRSEEHTSELQSLMRLSYAVFCLKKKKDYNKHRC